jgi:hypothetical protein
MKKIYSYLFFAIALFYNLRYNAQAPYHKMIASNTTDWYIFQAFIPVKMANPHSTPSIYLMGGKYSAIGDTNLLSTDYKKVYHVYLTPGFPQNSLLGYLREDTIAMKVYFLEKNTTNEKLLYDFSLTVGSTTILDFPSGSGTFQNTTYTVSSISPVLTKVGYRQQFKLTNAINVYDTLTYIESIGSIIHPLYLCQSYYGPGMFSFGGSSSCSYPYDLGLACKYSNNDKFFQSCTYQLAQMNNCIYKFDSCNYYTNCSGIKELTNVVGYKLVPNPTADITNLEIELANEETITVDLYDIFGRKIETLFNSRVSSDKTSIPLNLSKYQNGYYFIKTYGKDINLNNPIIIAR